MKTVGIILRDWKADVKKIPFYGIRTDLIEFLRKYDINVIGVPIAFDRKNEFNKVKEIIDFCDGIIFPGGRNVKEIDFEIITYLNKINKPTFGICLGMQIMGTAFDGKREKIEKRKS